MGGDWKLDKKWSDKYLPQIKRILGETFIGEPSVEEDQERNTDLIVLNMTGLRFACRIRKEHYFKDYSGEFTIRSHRPSAKKTELEKILEGWGDFMFYGFANEKEVFYWKIGDLKIFRTYFSRYCVKNKTVPGIKKSNKDSSSDFIAFKWTDLPKEFIYKES